MAFPGIIEMGRRGQIFTTDFIFASVVFLFIVVSVIYYSQLQNDKIYSFEKNSEIRRLALQASSILVEGSGPVGWEKEALTEVSGIGLASSRGVIEKSRVERFASFCESDCGLAKELIGLAKYNFRFSIKNENGNLLYEIKSKEPEKTETVFAINRIVVLNSGIALARIEVFE